MKRTYLGKYYDIDQEGNESPFSFQMDVEFDNQMNFSGSVWEEEFSELSGKRLSVKGFIEAEHISFVKKYPCSYEYDKDGKAVIDDSKPGHEVIYDGYFDKNTGTWTGEWEVEGQTDLKGLGEVTTEVFTGYFEMKMED